MNEDRPRSPVQAGLEVVLEPPGLIVVSKSDSRNQDPAYMGNGADAPIPTSTEPPVADRNINKAPKRICGLQALYFWLVLACCILVIAAAVGGGVGGSLANKGKGDLNSEASNSNVSSASAGSVSTTQFSSTTPSTSTAQPTTTSAVNATDCSSLNGTIYKSDNYSFLQLCNQDLCTSTSCNASTIDTEDLYTISIQDCIEKCLSYNAANNTVICKGVTWDIFAEDEPNYDERCFLKNDTSSTISAGAGFTLVSALMIDDT